MAEQGDKSDVVYDTKIRMASDEPGKAPIVAPNWTAAAAAGEIKPLEAHKRMLHEGAVLSSHLRVYQDSITKYVDRAKKFFQAVDEFMLSAGQPACYENRLTAAGAQVAASTAAATAEAAAATTDRTAAISSATMMGVTATSSSAGTPQSSSSSATSSTTTPFAPEAVRPTLPMQGPAGGVYLCPGVPGTPALGAPGFTHLAPADILLPRQHEALFRHEEQRRLINAGREELVAALSHRLLPAVKLWLDTFEECKALLPDVERLRKAADKARQKLEAAQAEVLAAEASAPLVSRAELEAAGDVVPKVLVQEHGKGLVAAPAIEQREAMYASEQEDTDAALAFELAEKVYRDKLTWLIKAGAGLKATAAAGMAHALRAAAAEGQPGEAAGGTAKGPLRAPREELLEPFPQHIMARLRGEHLPTLPQLVTADLARLSRWADRYKDEMAAAAAAAAAAAGAQMLAAAAAPPAGPADMITPGGQVGELGRTDYNAAGATPAGTAAAGGDSEAVTSKNTGSSVGETGSRTERPRKTFEQGASKLNVEIQQTAEQAGVPVELLAAAIEANVQAEDAAVAAASRADIAWHLVHDASVMAAKQEAVLLPALNKYVGGTAGVTLVNHHKQLADRLAAVNRSSPSDAGFDLAVLEVLEVLQQLTKDLEGNLLPDLAAAPKVTLSTLQQLAKDYRRSAATAPTRPHGWFIGSAAVATAKGSGRTDDNSDVNGAGTKAALSATAAAAKRVLAAPAKAAVGLVDAAADLARFGPGHVPRKA